MTNYEIADLFSLLSKLMDLHGENSFKSKIYSIAAYHIERLPKEIEEMDNAELFGSKGIGDSTGKKIREIQETGRLEALVKILEATPTGLLDIMQVKGLGPKKVAVIWKEMGIETLGELEYACNENRLTRYKGFGEKTQKAVLDAIAFMRKNAGFHLWAEVEEFGNTIISQMQKTFPANQFSLTGDIRRQNEIVGNIDIITDIAKDQIIEQFQLMEGIEIEDEEETTLQVRIPVQPELKFHFTTAGKFYADLFVTTGSTDFIKAFNEKYTVPGNVATEEEIFKHNSLQFIPPAQRETSSILDVAAKNELEPTVTAKDIKGIIHNHSKWSDGEETIENMAKAAIAQGFEYLVISDHSQAAYYAQGLEPERIAAQHIEVDGLNAKLAPFKIFKSIEADILNDGSLDYNSQVLSTFDLVIASVHSNLKMSEEKAMNRVMKAIENPYTTILGHPTGRLLLSREGYPLDHKKIIDACAANSVVIEINAHPRRLDIDWRWMEYALEKGVLLSIDPDAHSIHGFKDVYFGAKIAQKGGLTAKHNLSSFSLVEFEAFISQNRIRKIKG